MLGYPFIIVFDRVLTTVAITHTICLFGIVRKCPWPPRSTYVLIAAVNPVHFGHVYHTVNELFYNVIVKFI